MMGGTAPPRGLIDAAGSTAKGPHRPTHLVASSACS